MRQATTVTRFMFLLVLMVSTKRAMPAGSNCDYWVAPPPEGNDENTGSFITPWASMQYAEQNIPDAACTVWFKDGLYEDLQSLTRRFLLTTTFRAQHPYQAVFKREGTTIEIDGGRNMIFDGFVLQHSGPGAGKHVVIVDRSDKAWSENITFRNNIFHDSYNNDLLKIHNGVRSATVEGNVFYNQGSADQHIDVNSVTDVVIQDNIFFNDFAGSGRSIALDTKHFIVIKDSNEGDDGLLGSRRITVRRNVFLNFQGENASFVQVGNDGKPYHEAIGVRVYNNLMVGNSPYEMTAAFGVRGAKDVSFINNTVVGDLIASAYALWVSITEANPRNENITFANNIWSDPTGTMGVDIEGGKGEFSDGDPQDSLNVTLNNNLYWNGAMPIPPGELVSPFIDDAHRLVANPLLNSDHDAIVLPRWNGSAFLSGNRTIREEFVRLVALYGAIPATSPAVDRAIRQLAPYDDILRRRRGPDADLGAYEYFELVPPGNYQLFLPALPIDPFHDTTRPELETRTDRTSSAAKGR